ncbi:hypothetical protein GGI15_000830 [Coemansia interrupta]|uniref:Uncharacterized protein n=1 Tax=Coemansia interrupta TaxID=1126814 RepID=A0A9W8LP60_9FUNG|nr:hypothetical protein GGI15_000830 [Coemansia interrupta]
MAFATAAVTAARLVALATLVLAGISTATSEEVKMTDYPSVVYVANPYTICLGALIKEDTVMTDARCLYPFSDTNSVPSSVNGLLKPEYLMVALPTVNTSATMHGILLSTQVYTSPSQAGYRASTFLGLAETYVDNSTFFAVDTADVHAYYSQSQYIDNSEQNFDVGIVTLNYPLKKRQLASLYIDDVDANMSGLTALSFSSPNLSKDAATQQVLYEGIDLTKLRKTDVSSLSRSDCDSKYKAAYGLKDMKSFYGHSLPGNNSPVFCSSIYDNVTYCDTDTSITISKQSSNEINSVNLNSTVFFVPDGSSIRVVSIGNPHLFEVRTDALAPCESNGFIYFPRTGLYTDWIGWATDGSIASNGTWIDKKLTGDAIADFVDNRGGDNSGNDSGGESTTSAAVARLSGTGVALATTALLSAIVSFV